MLSLLIFTFVVVPCLADYTVTVFPEFLSQNGRTHFENDRFDNHNGLDSKDQIQKNKQIGTEGARWMNRDINGNIYVNVPQSHQRHGYPDANHFNDGNFQRQLTGKYMDNLNGYGRDLDTVMVINSKHWPHWLDTSHHGGIFPNNLDAGAEFTSLMLGAINHHAGTHPPYFEVINEPDTMWKHVNWETVIEYHKVVAHKLKSKFSKIKVGGPTYTGSIVGADKNDFRVWGFIKKFLDMSLYHMDFFSFHPYSSFHSRGNSHHFEGANEARVVAVIDLISSYSNMKRGFSVPLIVSEYGLGNLDADSHTPTDVSRWAYVYLHHGYMFTFLNFRNIMERAVAFILSHDSFGFEVASLFDNHGHETFVGNAYRFWKYFNYNQQFLRVESQYHGGERPVSSHALADPTNKKVTVLLHNYHNSAQQVKLDFHNRWISPTGAQSSCIYLENHKPVFKHGVSVHLNNGAVTVPGEGTCFFTFNTGHNFGGTHVVDEHTHYSTSQVYHINHNVAQATVNLDTSSPHSAYLRIAVSNANKGAHTTPRAVHINGHTTNDHYYLHDADRQHSNTLWEVYHYRVPTNILKHGANTVKMDFSQSGGYVSTVALVVGKLKGGSGVVG